MTFQLTTQILLAERDLPVRPVADVYFVPASKVDARWLSARALRASARFGLKLADRLERGYRLAA